MQLKRHLMELQTVVRIVLLLILAAIVVTWLENKSIAAKARQQFLHREPAEQTIFVLCPIITRDLGEVADAISSIVHLVQSARWPEALSIGIVHLADKYLPARNQEPDMQIASHCERLGISNIHIKYKRFKLPTDKQLRRNRTLTNFTTLEFARTMGIRHLYNHEDYVMLMNPEAVKTEPWWDSILIDTHRSAIAEGHERPIVSCVPQFQGIYAFDGTPEYVARVSTGAVSLIPLQKTPWVCPWFAFLHSRFIYEKKLPFDTAQPDDMQVTSFLWSNEFKKRGWTVVLPSSPVATGHLVRNGPFEKHQLERLRKTESSGCVKCGHLKATHGHDHIFQAA